MVGQSVEIKEKKGEKYLIIKKKVVAGPFASVQKVYATSQYIVKADQWGIVDDLGNEVVSGIYDSISHANSQYYVVKKDEKYGIIDTAGMSVVEPKFENIDHFTQEQSGLVKFEGQWMFYRDNQLYSNADSLIFRSPERMPKFSNCADGRTGNRGMNCDTEEMLEFVFQNIEYPKEAIRKGVEGMVVVKFIIEKDGRLTNHEIAREIGGGCGAAAIKVVEEMDPWVPGMQDGEMVRTAFYLPIKFAN